VRLYGEWILVPDDAVVTELTSSGLALSGHTWTRRARRGSDASCRGRAHRRSLFLLIKATKDNRYSLRDATIILVA
jgi:hypothetical protein